MPHPLRGAVPGIGAALHHHVDGSAALHAELRGRRFLYSQFLDRFRREQRRGYADDTSLPYRRIAVIAIVVVKTVDKVVVRSSARPVDADSEKPTTWSALHSGRNREE